MNGSLDYDGAEAATGRLKRLPNRRGPAAPRLAEAGKLRALLC